MVLETIVIVVGMLQSNSIIVYDPDTLDAVIFDAGGGICLSKLPQLLLFFHSS